MRRLVRAPGLGRALSTAEEPALTRVCESGTAGRAGRAPARTRALTRLPSRARLQTAG